MEEIQREVLQLRKKNTDHEQEKRKLEEEEEKEKKRLKEEESANLKAEKMRLDNKDKEFQEQNENIKKTQKVQEC